MDTSEDNWGWQQVLRSEGNVGQAKVNVLSDDNPAAPAPCHPPPPSTGSIQKMLVTTMALPRFGHPQRRLVRQRQ